MHRRTVLSSLAATGALTALTACGSGADTTTPAAGPATPVAPTADGVFPVTVEHQYGSTVVPARPERVVTVGFNEQDFVLALGVVPVGTRAYFGYEYQTRPWAVDRLPATPLPEVGGQEGVNLESVAALAPDLLVGTYSFVDEPTYRSLTGIAPTLPGLSGEEGASTATWQQNLAAIGVVLGLPEEAAALTADVEGAFAATRDAHPEFAGKVVSVVLALESGYYGLDGTDPRGDFFLQCGFTASSTTGEVSAENVPKLDTDVLVVLGRSEAEFTADPLAAAMAVVTQGRTVYVESFEDDFAGALGFSSPLSLPFALELAVPQLAAAADDDPSTRPSPL